MYLMLKQANPLESWMPLIFTGIRTGASGAIGAKYLAKKNSENLLIIGAGNQSPFQIAATLKAVPTIKKVQVASKDYSDAKAFIDTIAEKLEEEFNIDTQGLVFYAVIDLEQAVKESDVIITVTPSRQPIIKKGLDSKRHTYFMYRCRYGRQARN